MRLFGFCAASLAAEKRRVREKSHFFEGNNSIKLHTALGGNFSVRLLPFMTIKRLLLQHVALVAPVGFCFCRFVEGSGAR